MIQRRLHFRIQTLVAAAVAALAAPGVSPAPAGSIEVRVVTASGAPLAGARAGLWRERDGALEREAAGESDAEGRVRLVAPVVGRLKLSVSASGFRRAEREITAASTGPVLVRLDRGRQISVSVVDAVTGRPVPRFTALVLPAGAAGASGRLRYVLDGLDPVSIDDPDGRARLTGLGESRLTLTVRAAGYPVGLAEVTAGAEPIVIALDRTGCVERWVFDSETGAPIAGAAAAADAGLLREEILRLAPPPESDEVGRLDLCPAPGVTELLIVHPDYAPVRIPAPLAVEGQESSASIQLGRGGAIAGMVSDSDGRPVVGARVRTTTLGLPRETTTGPDGRYFLDHLAAGDATVEVFPPVDSPAPATRRRATIRGGETARLDFDATRALRIQLREQDRPREGATLVLLESGPDGRVTPTAVARTDAEGMARFPGVGPDREGLLVAVVEEGAAVFMSVGATGAAAAAVVRLEGRRIRGTVADADTHEPLRGARLLCSTGGFSVRYDPRPGPLWIRSVERQIVAQAPSSFAAADAAGRFEFFLPRWCDGLRVAGPETGGAEAPWRPVRIPAAEVHENAALSVVLERGRLILASVSSSAELLDALVEVSLHRPGGRAALGSAAPDGGVARLTPEDAGPWMVIARAPGWAPALAGPVSALDPTPLRLALFMERGGLLIVRLPTPGDDLASASGVVGQTFQLLDAAGRDWTTFVEATAVSPDGMTTLGPLPAGRYTLRAGDVRRTATIRGDGDTQEADLNP